MADAGTTEERSWLPLALAGAFLVFAVVVALLAYLGDGGGDPARARTVFDVAELTVEAFDDEDAALYTALQCTEPDDLLAPYVGSATSATRSDVIGVQTGTFHLTVEGEESAEFDVTVEQVDGRSCIDQVTLLESTR